MTITRTPLGLCPLCGHQINAHESLEDPESVPGPGDWTVCVGCASVLEYDGGMRLKIVPKADVAKELAEGNEGLAGTITAVRRALAVLGPPGDLTGPRQ